MNDQVMAAFTNKLQVPMILADLLNENCEAAQQDDFYALSALISDMSPAFAIAAIAAGLKFLVQPYAFASPSLQMTTLSCMRVIEDVLLGGFDAEGMDDFSDDDVEECLEHSETLVELLELNIVYLRCKDALAVRLCEMLLAQLKAQEHLLMCVRSLLQKQSYSVPRGKFDDGASNVVSFMG